MTKRLAQLIPALAICLLLVAAPRTVRADGKPVSYLLGMGFQFATGTYGTSTRTDTIVAPVSLAVNPTDRLGFSVTLPYVYQSNDGVLATLSQNGTQTATKQSQSGVGDLTLLGTYVLVPEKPHLPQVRASVIVKVPTADKNKGLGTGEFDEGITVGLSKWFSKWYTFAEAGYTFQGKTSLYALRNYTTFNAGVGYQVSSRFRPTISVRGSTPMTDGSGYWVETNLDLFYLVARHTGIEGYVGTGLTAGSPDYGTGLSVYYEF